MALARPREAALIGTATRLFRQRGFHATSMQDLAEALGMNRGSLYHYIESKDDLLWWIVSSALDRLDGRVRPLLEGRGTPAERLRAAIAAHLAFAAEHGDELTLIQVEMRSLPEERRAQLVERRDAYERTWRAVVAEAAGDTLDAGRTKLATIAVLSACNWFTQWYRPEGALSVEQIGDVLGDLFVAGIGGLAANELVTAPVARGTGT